MSARHKVLLLDDDQDVLDLYRDMLSRLPSHPEIFTATSGARALSLLESEPFTLLISDLNMPKMDGLQVLTIVRRKFPDLRTAVMTSVVDEQFRTRAYGIGIDLFLEKPQNSKEISFFLDCIESLLAREKIGGFRGVQSKSLVDIIQLECLSKNSSVLKITNALIEGRIWIQDGDVIDAAVQDLSGEKAFQKILSWKAGSFELFPGEASRPRTIQGSYQGLLLETAQVLDERQACEGPNASAGEGAAADPLAKFARHKGVEFLLELGQTTKAWGVENPDQLAGWCRRSWDKFAALGDQWLTGTLQRIEGFGAQRNVALVSKSDHTLAVGFSAALSRDEMRDTLKTIAATWAS